MLCVLEQRVLTAALEWSIASRKDLRSDFFVVSELEVMEILCR